MLNNTDAKKIKMLIAFTTFRVCGGTERFLLNLLELFPVDRYEIDLLLFDDEQDSAKMFDLIPSHVNVLPFLKQYSKWSPSLMKELESSGHLKSVQIRNFINARNIDSEFKVKPIGVRHEENWELLKELCPEYSGYDIAIAIKNSLPLKIVAEKVNAKNKFVFLHFDIKAATESKEHEESLYRYEKKYYEQMNGIVCIANQNADSFRSFFPELAHKVKVLININNMERILRDAEAYYPEEYRGNENNLLTIARIHPQKGIELLLLTAKKLKDLGVNFRWFVLGGNYEDAYLKKCNSVLETLNLNSHVLFLGERQNPFPYYKNCTLYVQTSLFEGRPLSIEEAMSLNCPIITTNFSSVKEQIIDGVNGIICEFDSEQLASDIIYLLNNPKERQRLAESNAGYDGTGGAEKYLELFK
ncbi:glycosyltransferase [Cohnella sp. GCM10020058]|uniref:glycosyltransferase n=1 Tax=Cohnella sp. GCM10020058 TaxID=3317330 RepID=UPI00363B5971